MCLHEIYGIGLLHKGKHLSDTFSIRSSLKEEEASYIVTNFQLAFVIRH
jgi:hypothetical protein